MLDVMHLGRRYAEAGQAPRLVVQMLDDDHADLAVLTGPDDLLISSALGSQFIAQLIEQPPGACWSVALIRLVMTRDWKSPWAGLRIARTLGRRTRSRTPTAGAAAAVDRNGYRSVRRGRGAAAAVGSSPDLRRCHAGRSVPVADLEQVARRFGTDEYQMVGGVNHLAVLDAVLA